MLLEQKTQVPLLSRKINLSPPVSRKTTNIRTFIFFPCRINGNRNLQNKGMMLRLLFVTARADVQITLRKDQTQSLKNSILCEREHVEKFLVLSLAAASFSIRFAYII